MCKILLTADDGKTVFPLLWAQGVGCGIMGLGLANKNWIVSIYPPLYTAIATGPSPFERRLTNRNRGLRYYFFILDASRLSSILKLRSI
jgi:hypothetical protein